MTRVRQLLTSASVAVAALLPLLTPSPAYADTTTGRTLLSRLPVAAEAGSSTYDRTLFKHWVDADHDCQNTRAEVLIVESRTAPSFTTSSRCTVAKGQWVSYYDGATWTAPGDVDIDHLSPLKETWESGARNWTAAQRQAYANDLAWPGTLVAVTDSVNQAKGDRDPAEWLPPLASARCRYALEWVQVKYRWRLSVDAAEKRALTNLLAGSCGDKTVTVPPRGF